MAGGREARHRQRGSSGEGSPALPHGPSLPTVPSQSCSWPLWTGMARRTPMGTTQLRRAAGSWSCGGGSPSPLPSTSTPTPGTTSRGSIPCTWLQRQVRGEEGGTPGQAPVLVYQPKRVAASTSSPGRSGFSSPQGTSPGKPGLPSPLRYKSSSSPVPPPQTKQHKGCFHSWLPGSSNRRGAVERDSRKVVPPPTLSSWAESLPGAGSSDWALPRRARGNGSHAEYAAPKLPQNF